MKPRLSVYGITAFSLLIRPHHRHGCHTNKLEIFLQGQWKKDSPRLKDSLPYPTITKVPLQWDRQFIFVSFHLKNSPERPSALASFPLTSMRTSRFGERQYIFNQSLNADQFYSRMNRWNFHHSLRYIPNVHYSFEYKNDIFYFIFMQTIQQLLFIVIAYPARVHYQVHYVQ